MVLADLPVRAILVVATLFGLLWGSFLNVVIYRLPRGESLAYPGSHCPACGAAIAPYDNVPLVSYLILAGRARCCGARMSLRYPLVELLGGAAGWAAANTVLQELGGNTRLLTACALFVATLALALGLVAAAFIDWEHMFLPDSITLGGALLGLLSAPLRQMGFGDSAFAGGIAFVMIWLPFIVLYKRVRGFSGMGLGDAKLLALAGTWFGLRGAVFVLFVGAIQGTLGALLMLAIRRKIEEPASVVADRKALENAARQGDEEARVILAEDPIAERDADGVAPLRIAFGPFLILAILELLFFGKPINTLIDSYLSMG